MRHVWLKGMNDKPISNFNIVNIVITSNGNNYKPTRPLSCKGKPFAKANLHELLSNVLVDNNEYEYSDIGVEDAIEVN